MEKDKPCCNTFKQGFIYISLKNRFNFFQSALSNRGISIFFCIQCQKTKGILKVKEV